MARQGTVFALGAVPLEDDEELGEYDYEEEEEEEGEEEEEEELYLTLHPSDPRVRIARQAADGAPQLDAGTCDEAPSLCAS